MPKTRATVPPSVKDTLARAAHGEVLEPQLADLASHFFRAAGGPRAVAGMLFNEFRKAKEGSLTRQRILDLVLRCVRFANERNPARGDPANMDEADIDRELAGLVADMAAAVGGGGERAERAEPEAAEAAAAAGAP